MTPPQIYRLEFATVAAVMIAISALAVLSLAGCARTPAPDAPVVMADPVQVTCPEPAPRQAPADLVQPLGLEAPTILKAGEGDYGITRSDLEKIVGALRAAAGRINQWRAWGAPSTSGGADR